MTETAITNMKITAIIMLEKQIAKYPEDKTLKEFMQYVNDRQEISETELEFFKNHSGSEKVRVA